MISEQVLLAVLLYSTVRMRRLCLYNLGVLFVLACLLTTTFANRHHPIKMPHILKNPDGTVNFDAVKKETDFLKG